MQDLGSFTPNAWHNPRLGGRIRELDGVRGLAILLVLIYHYFAITIVTRPGTWERLAVHALDFTWSGVDLFFVLSGLLIGGILIDAQHAPNFYRTFYLRRIHRIFPIYYLWLGLFVLGWGLAPVAGHAALSSASLAIFNHSIPFWSYPLFLQNFAMASRGEFGAQWLAVTWSLAIEEQFYLLLPCLIRNISRKSIPWIAAGMIALAPLARISLYLAANSYLGPYTLLPCRMDALGWGLLLAWVLRNQPLNEMLERHRNEVRWMAVALAALVLTLMTRPVMSVAFMGLGYSSIAAFYALALLLVTENPGRVGRQVLGSKFLVGLGSIAYAVYLFHQGVSYLWHAVVFAKPPRVDSWQTLGVTLVALLSTIVLAMLSWRFIEAPLVDRAHRTTAYETAAAESLASGRAHSASV